jgi:hypothetical protein
MSDANAEQTVFLTLVRTPGERACARVLVDSIRAFGGALSSCPIWIYDGGPREIAGDSLAGPGVQVLPLCVPDTVRGYAYAAKVTACAQAEECVRAQAEERAAAGVRSLTWIDPVCLIVRPPVLFDLGPSFDAAVRPVHIQNVGLAPQQPLDPFWRAIYAAVGVQDVRTTVETFVEGRRIRSYFNSHAFAVNPARGLFGRWFEDFETLVGDRAVQERACRDTMHQVFLHSALLSALLATQLDPGRVRLLPPDYSYPYNLHHSVPPERRAVALNDLVSVAYEKRSLDPALVDDIIIREPLRSWLAARAARC